MLAGVEDPPGAGRDGGFDGVAVQADHVGGRVVAGHHEHLFGAGEGVAQRGRVLVGALPDAHAAVGEVPRLGRVADADADPVGGQALKEVLDGGAAQSAGGTGDNDHVPGLSLNARGVRLSTAGEP